MLDFKEQLIPFNGEVTNAINTMSVAFRKSTISLFSRDFNYTNSLGGYNKIERSKVDSLLSAIKINDSIPQNITGEQTSTTNLTYLRLLADYCKTQGKNVYLIRTPCHPKYPGYRNEHQFQKIRTSQFSDIPFLDFSKFTLSKNYFADLEHLNYEGANVFSKWFNEMISNGLLESSDKQAMIDKSIKSRVEAE